MGASVVIINDAPGARTSDDAMTSFYASSRFRPLEIAVLYPLPDGWTTCRVSRSW
jgi:hypothetical protein